MIKFDFTKSQYNLICEECMLSEEEKLILKLRCIGNSAVQILLALDENGIPMSASTLSRRISKIDNKIKKAIREDK